MDLFAGITCVGVAWHWIVNIPDAVAAPQAGTSAFVQIVTGINLAACAWDKFRDQLEFPARQCRAMTDPLTCTLLDTCREDVTRCISRVQNFVCGTLRKAWILAFTLMCLSCVIGLYMLWANRYCYYSFLLLAPLIVYFIASNGLLWIFYCVIKFTKWLANTFKAITPQSLLKDSQLSKEIGQLEGEAEQFAQTEFPGETAKNKKG